ncbi:MAG TPA: hypothetical protein VM097_11810 [Mycobacteriales bacterium]|nr:hypothetical protein [Mycobacteriales bacterium]
MSRERLLGGEQSGVRRALVLVRVLVLGALLLLPAPSRAAGLGADVMIGGQAHFTLYGSDRASYLVDVVAKASEAGSRTGTGSVTVTIKRCLGLGCTRYVYRGALSTRSFAVATDLSSGSLTTALFGRGLQVTWSGPQSSTLPAYELDANAPRVAVRLYEVTRVQGVLLGRRCGSKEGLVSREALVATEPAVEGPLPRALPRALAGLARATC